MPPLEKTVKKKDVANLTPAERGRAQKHAMLGHMMGPFAGNVVAGQYMMLFATDVLQYNPLTIAAIVAFTPLITFFRLPMMGPVRQFGRIRTLKVGRSIQVLAIVLLLLTPAHLLTPLIYAGLIFLFLISRELGIGLVWQSLLRDYTTNEDRGKFFARMRFSFNTTNLVLNGIIIFLVGKAVTEGVYKGMLLISLAGMLNSLFWIKFLPDTSAERRKTGAEEGTKSISFLNILRHSPLMRLPLLVTLLTTAASLPLGVIYFRQMLHVPANLVAMFIFFSTTGSALFFFLWGRLADTIGFRPMLIGMLLLTAVSLPLILFVPPFPEQGLDWNQLQPATVMGIGALLFLGFSNGALLSGIGIAVTSIQLHHVSRKDSFEALNVLAVISAGFQAVVAFLAGLFIQKIAIPNGSMPIGGGIIYLDWYKGFAAMFSPVLLFLTIPIVWRLPNVRPWFGVSHFFNAIMNSPARTLLAIRNVYDETPERRTKLAHWFGLNSNPMSIEPLLALLHDPAYEVRTEATRSLARSGSTLAGKELQKVLQDEERRALWDQAAWALGELKYLPACDLLVERLSLETPARVRIMAARALGKLEESGTIFHLLKAMKEEKLSLTLVSACCLSLLPLDAKEHAEEVFRALLRLRNREDRYELMSEICLWLDITSGWLLHSSSADSSWQSLHQHLEWKSSSWLEKRQNVIGAFREKDQDKIFLLMEERLRKFPSQEGMVEGALAKVGRETGGWSHLSVLAAAWLLFVD